MREIQLTRGQVAIVDDQDFELISAFKWSAAWNPHTRTFYAQAHTPYVDGKRSTVRMHRLILGLVDGQLGDHINGDTLDNRRSNLRPATASQNSMNRRRRKDNTSGMRGVRQYHSGKWVARIGIGGKLKHLGYFTTAEEAYAAYGKAAIELHGEFMGIR